MNKQPIVETDAVEIYLADDDLLNAQIGIILKGQHCDEGIHYLLPITASQAAMTRRWWRKENRVALIVPRRAGHEMPLVQAAVYDILAKPDCPDGGLTSREITTRLDDHWSEGSIYNALSGLVQHGDVVKEQIAPRSFKYFVPVILPETDANGRVANGHAGE